MMRTEWLDFIMGIDMRAVIVSITLFLVGVLEARAESYRVDYAVKLQAGEATGSVNCHYDERCVVDLKTLQMKLSISILRNYRGRADLVLDGKNNCCLFDGATRRPSINPRQPGMRLRLFTGEAARGLEYVENEPIGLLYLRFNLDGSDCLEAPCWQHTPI
ncbi:hypothetical protein BRAS3843_670012 [Bradyrhizobium sp. STM 3843]|uniref:hypothetical protein n=1 Tax=Bradyrhizobium sp. STM 3843 TaxID=551947 RepID=UPI00024032AE|nr:hypothetical protein [Bradyrhizobium sp. STM 3843]CCE11309.1 hypothetical protein BRAS3843_670012 [Bradyrhizobium sp. STM 3843]